MPPSSNPLNIWLPSCTISGTCRHRVPLHSLGWFISRIPPPYIFWAFQLIAISSQLWFGVMVVLSLHLSQHFGCHRYLRLQTSATLWDLMTEILRLRHLQSRLTVCSFFLTTDSDPVSGDCTSWSRSCTLMRMKWPSSSTRLSLRSPHLLPLMRSTAYVRSKMWLSHHVFRSDRTQRSGLRLTRTSLSQGEPQRVRLSLAESSLRRDGKRTLSTGQQLLPGPNFGLLLGNSMCSSARG